MKHQKMAPADNPMRRLVDRPWIPYVAPFALFILITAAAKPFPNSLHIFYIAKTTIVGAMLWRWRKEYQKDLSTKISLFNYVIAATAGIVVLVIWVVPEKLLPQLGEPTGFDPYAFGWPDGATILLIVMRLAGASIVVPIMEELFWRSFLLRYAINPNFQSVALGTFRWFAFIAVVVLFGLEHHRFIQGMTAGIVYTLLVIKQKNLKGSILAHGITNLGLGIYVLKTKNWLFW